MCIGDTYVAAASILAGIAVTLIGLYLTGFAAVSRTTGTGVAALPRVGTGGFVMAWLVVGAVVQV